MKELSNKYQVIATADVINSIEVGLSNAGVSGKLTANREYGRKSYSVITLDSTIQVFRDSVTPTIHVLNSTDGSSSLTIAAGMIRWACHNGLVAGDTLFHEKIRHVTGPTATRKLNSVAPEVERVAAYLAGDFANDIQDLTSKTITVSQATDIIKELNITETAKGHSLYHLQRPRRDADVGDTLWHLYNNVNESIRKTTRGGFADVSRNFNLLKSITKLAA